MNTLPFEVTESVLSYLTMESDFRKLKSLNWRLARQWIEGIHYLDFRNGESYYNGDYTLKECPQALPAEKVLQLADRCPRVRVVSLPPLKVTLPNLDITTRIIQNPKYRDVYLIVDYRQYAHLLPLSEGISSRQIYNGQFSYNWHALRSPLSKHFIYDYGSLDESSLSDGETLISNSMVHTIINPPGDRPSDRVIINHSYVLRWIFDVLEVIGYLSPSVRVLEVRMPTVDIVGHAVYMDSRNFSDLSATGRVFPYLETLTLPIDTDIDTDQLKVVFPKVKSFVIYQHLLYKHKVKQVKEMQLEIDELYRSVKSRYPQLEL